MKLFFKDHLDIICLYAFNLVFLSFFYYTIDGFKKISNAIYFSVLSIFLLIITLLYRYYRKRKLYNTLEKKPYILDEMVYLTTHDFVTNEFIKFNKANYQNYLKQLDEYKSQTADWQLATIQWVHQMKTPISVIRLLIQNNPKKIDTFQVLYELDRLNFQLDLILNLARMDNFKNDMVIDELSLNDIVKSVIQENKRLFIQNEIYPRFEAEKNITIYSDKKWLEFIITQLIHNAVKFSTPDSKLFVTIASNLNHSVLMIQDFGIGIKKKDMPRIFELYYTGTNGRENNQSSGIGLYLVKRIIDELNYQIKVESTENEGTKVYIYFPLEK